MTPPMTVDEALKRLGALVDGAPNATDADALALSVIGRALGPDGIIGAYEFCQMLGVRSGNLPQIVGLPAPRAKPRCGSIWLRPDAEPFVEARKTRLAGATE